MTDDRETKWAINLETVHCPQCKQRMPAFRVPTNLHQLMWGGWTCPKCGCQMDKMGKPLSKTQSRKGPE